MILFKKAESLSHYLKTVKQDGKTTGFVPTMGALHAGHLSLLKEAKKLASLTVCSIFVNPTQFNNADDFSNYPITLEQDIEHLVRAGCDVLFLPPVAEIYPAAYQAPVYPLGYLENVLEGIYRPGHFQGVCQVVDRLLQIVDPGVLLLGQKDFQQCQVIARLLKITGRNNTQLSVAPTIRESDGLAMSSRNLRLNKSQREKATALYQALTEAKEALHTHTPEQVSSRAKQNLEQKGFRVDYFAICDAATLLPATDHSKKLIALVAAYLDNIRLIDNLPLN